jgi:hypothetical protein
MIRIQNITTVQTDDQDTKHNNSTNRWSGYKTQQQDKQTIFVSWSSVCPVVMFCILIVCLSCCCVLYPDHLFVLLLCFVSWSSVCTVVMFCILIVCLSCCYVLYPEVQIDDQDTKHDNRTNRWSGYKTQQQDKQTIKIQTITKMSFNIPLTIFVFI